VNLDCPAAPVVPPRRSDEACPVDGTSCNGKILVLFDSVAHATITGKPIIDVDDNVLQSSGT
jgi:hypothetical protein